MKEFHRLVKIMERLRGPDGCPWDREQRPEDLKGCLLEEAYEVMEAIDRGNPGQLREELGDLLLQVVFLSQMAREQGEFSIREVIRQITDKILRRHPHVFGKEKLESSDQVLNQWERIKAQERQAADSYLLEGVPRTLPALFKALRLASKAARVGFDWDSASGAYAKVKEELRELREAEATGDPGRVRQELGDFLFAAANLARHLGLNPEEALQEANRKFVRRFTHIERNLRRRGKKVSDADPAELDALWEEAKTEEAAGARGGKPEGKPHQK